MHVCMVKAFHILDGVLEYSVGCGTLKASRKSRSRNWRGCHAPRWITGCIATTGKESPDFLIDPTRRRVSKVPAGIRSRILAATRMSPPADTGLSHWSSREMAAFIKRTEDVSVSHNYVAKLWRETGLKPHRIGTFKVSKDPAFAEKVADVVGLYLDPPGGAVILSMDEKTQIQALDRTQPMLPITFDATEKRTHDYRRNGTTNLFAALNVGTGEVFGECMPTRNGDDFLSFLKKAVKRHTGKEIHVVLDNLSPTLPRR